MKNIEYLEHFFRKHNLSGKIKVKYSYPTNEDDYMTDITFTNGDVININDIIFDIDSDFPNSVFDQWIVAKRKTDMSLMDWMLTNKYDIFKDIDISSVQEYQNEMTEIVDNVKKSISSVFELEPDDGDSEDE